MKQMHANYLSNAEKLEFAAHKSPEFIKKIRCGRI